MVIYQVTWKRDDTLAKGTTKGRPRSGFDSFCFSVLCRSSKDATACLEYLFPHHFGFHCGFSVEDGCVTLKRSKVDSRGFEFQWVMLDKMKKPLLVSDLYNDRIDVPNFRYPSVPVSERPLIR